jgi:hypothetical protein
VAGGKDAFTFLTKFPSSINFATRLVSRSLSTTYLLRRKNTTSKIFSVTFDADAGEAEADDAAVCVADGGAGGGGDNDGYDGDGDSIGSVLGLATNSDDGDDGGGEEEGDVNVAAAVGDVDDDDAALP